MTELPTGTVTFLFTDIEGSTELASELGDEPFADLQETHRRLLRDAFASNGGAEVRTEGDMLFVAFTRATEAADAAIDGQRALESHAWPANGTLRVRMGLHTGEATVREDDYVGHDVNKARRVCDAGHGGQIVVSEATAALLDAYLPRGTSLADLGLHRLKDLSEPQHLYQLAAPGIRRDFPAPRSIDAFTHNLPSLRSTFIGRDQEIAEVRKLLERHRLVTLAGVGGCGKTRLALQIGAEELDRFEDGVFFIELGPLSDASLIAGKTADAIGLILGGSLTGGTPTPLDELVVDHLRRKTSLLIFDNCEHLLDGCAELVDRVLAQCPDVTILATTREALGVEGEQAWRIPSMSLPTGPSDMEASEAIRLFDTRAKAVLPSFELTADNAEAVREICARLDGLPLAIELAASRVTHLSPRQLADRLDDMFRLLAGGRRRVQRQQTLEASLDWSYDLLDEPERALLRRLAVFSGTFGLDAAEGICTDGHVTHATVVTLLGSLVDKSLVATEAAQTQIRYRLLEPVRLYAAEHLRASGEAEAFRQRHHDRFLEWVESFPPDEATFGFAALRSFEAERDNLRAALEWSAAHGRHDLVARLANGLLTLWWNGGHYDEGYHWLTAVVENEDELGASELAAAYAGLTACAVMRVDARADGYAARAVDVAGGKQAGAGAIALSLDAITSAVAAEATRDAALISRTRERAQRAIDAGAVAGPAWQAFALVAAGQIELVLRDVASAARFLEEAFGLWRVPSVSAVASSSGLAVARHVLGDVAGALEAGRVAAEVEEEWWQPGMGANAFGLALAGVGDLDEARRRLGASIQNARNWGVDLWVNEVLIFCGAVAFLGGDPARTSRLLAAGRHLGGARKMLTPFRTGQSYALYLHYVSLVRDSLGARDARRTRVEARAMSLDEAVAYALEGLEN